MKLSMTPLVAATMAVSAHAGSLRPHQRVLNELTPSDHVAMMTEKVMYECTVSSSWSSVNQPVDYPADAHLSPPVLVAHTGGYKMFTPGMPVSAAVKLVAETGDPTELITELEAGVAADTVWSYIVGGAMWFDGLPAESRKLLKKPGDAIAGREQTISSPLTFTPDAPYFTSITMLAPSPDWVSTSHGLSMIDESGNWYKSVKIETKPYDAGTDSGVTFAADNNATTPAVGIQQFSSTAPAAEAAAGIFQNADGEVLPLLKWACSIVDVKYDCEKKPDAEGCEAETDDETSPDESAAGKSFAGLAASALVAGAYFLL